MAFFGGVMQKVTSSHALGGRGRKTGAVVQVLECGDAVEGTGAGAKRRVCFVCTKNQVRESEKKITLTKGALEKMLSDARKGTTGN